MIREKRAKPQRPRAVLRKIVIDHGIYWALTVLAEIVREDLTSIVVGQIPERLARNIEKARDAT